MSFTDDGAGGRGFGGGRDLIFPRRGKSGSRVVREKGGVCCAPQSGRRQPLGTGMLKSIVKNAPVTDGRRKGETEGEKQRDRQNTSNEMVVASGPRV